MATRYIDTIATYSNDYININPNEIRIGDNTTGSDKKITANNGEANEPYLFYDESENAWSISNDGSSAVAIPTTSGGGTLNVTAKTAAYTATSGDDVITCDASSAAFTITLPAIASSLGKVFIIKKTDSDFTKAVTVDANASETIDGDPTKKLNTQNESIEIVGGASEWHVIKRSIPSIPVSYTPTGSWSTNTTYTGYWTRKGNTLSLDIRIALAGAPTAADLTVNLPSGLVIESTDITTQNANITNWTSQVAIRDSGTATYSAVVRYSSTTAIALGYDTGAGTISNVSNVGPITFASGDYISIKVNDIPISGWEF